MRKYQKQIDFGENRYNTVNKFATRLDLSFNEAVRRLVDFGLDNFKEHIKTIYKSMEDK